MKRIVVPRNPGIGCALGLLLTDLRANFATTRLATLGDGVIADMAEIFAGLEAQGLHWFAEEKVAPTDRTLRHRRTRAPAPPPVSTSPLMSPDTP